MHAPDLKGVVFGYLNGCTPPREYGLGHVTHAWECQGLTARRISIEEGQRLMEFSAALD
jgi:hypothetical protein